MNRIRPAALFVIAICLLTPLHGWAENVFKLTPFYRTATLSGLTHPRKEMTITSEASGRCKEIYADVSEVVPPSGTFAEIDTTFLDLDIESNKIAREQARRQLDQEKKTLERYTVLVEQKSTPQATFDEVALQVDLYNLTLKKLENEALRLQEQRERHTIRAPAGWQVIERYVEPGEFVQAGQPIAHLGDFQSLLVKFAVTYEELKTLEDRQQLSLLLPDVGKQVNARIYMVSPVFDVKTRKIPMELEISSLQENLLSPLRGGMRAELVFKSTAATGTYIVPLSALLSRYEAHWLVRSDGTKQQVVVLGRTEDESHAVISAETLSAGMVFLSDPGQSAD